MQKGGDCLVKHAGVHTTGMAMVVSRTLFVNIEHFIASHLFVLIGENRLHKDQKLQKYSL